MAYIQGVNENSYSTTLYHDIVLTGVTEGSTLILACRVANGASYEPSAVSSSLDGALTVAENFSNGAFRIKVYILENASAGTHTLTITSPTVNNTVRMIFAEYGDVPTASVIEDSTSGSFTTTTNPTTATITTTGASRTIISIVSTDSSATTIVPATGETEQQELNERFQLQDEAASTAGDYSASWTLGATQPGTYVILALKPAVTVTKYLKVLAHSSAASASSVQGVVFSVPSGGSITGTTRYGEFTGKTFEATLESGKAVLKVPVADFGGSALTTSDTPVALVRNTTKTTGIISCTVIEE